jgi:hypothetical protein
MESKPSFCARIPAPIVGANASLVNAKAFLDWSVSGENAV